MGFENNLFLDLSEREAKHLQCPICLNIFRDGIKSECEHTFCKDCVHQWIKADNNSCPECRLEFDSRKRSFDDISQQNLVIVSNYTFKRNLLANNLVNDLLVKCHFAFNGCPNQVQLGLLSSHLKLCKHKFCTTCGLTMAIVHNGRGNCIGQHNCVQSLKDLLKTKDSEYEKQLKVQLEAKDLMIRNQTEDIRKYLRVILSMAQQNKSSIEYILIGSFKTTVQSLQMSQNDMKFMSLSTNNEADQKKYLISLKFTSIQEVMHCCHPSLKAIIIRVDTNSCHQIQEPLYLGQNSPNDYKFDVNSIDSKHWYISVVFAEKSPAVYNSCIRYLAIVEPSIKTRPIGLDTARQLLQENPAI